MLLFIPELSDRREALAKLTESCWGIPIGKSHLEFPYFYFHSWRIQLLLHFHYCICIVMLLVVSSLNTVSVSSIKLLKKSRGNCSLLNNDRILSTKARVLYCYASLRLLSTLARSILSRHITGEEW